MELVGKGEHYPTSSYIPPIRRWHWLAPVLYDAGKYGKGAVWVASRVPEGYATATANQARTRTFNQSDPENVLFSADLISFARSIGVFNGSSDSDFDFAVRL
jgi:dipeptidase